MLMRNTLVAVLIFAAAAVAQPGEPGRERGRFGPPGGGPGPGFQGGGARLLGAEAGMPGRVVKRAPYSADVITETAQVLPDGNRIRQTNTVRVYRDSEGRTRREQSLKTLGGLAPNANLPEVVFISDPVAGANYALNVANRSATRTNAPPASDSGRQRPLDRPGPKPQRPESAAGEFATRRRGGENIKTESLGRQTIEGVLADGTRTTYTIPAGQIGNEQPIQIVSETWYSDELKTVVLSKRSDPRSGEFVTRLSNVSRAEPPRTLFDVPADYKVTTRAGRGAPNPR